MKKLAPHLSLANHAIASNAWVLDDQNGNRFLIDTGHAGERVSLRYDLWRAGIGRPGDLTAVLLTHRHSDHAGNAAWIRKTFDCPVICHTHDAPHLTRESATPRKKLYHPGLSLYSKCMCLLEDHFPAFTPVDEVFDQGLWKWGFKVIPVPGHTEGSVILYHEPTKSAFTGDAILSSIPPFRFFEKPKLVEWEFSEDPERCKSNVRSFLKDSPPIDFLCSGHGPLIHKNVDEKLKKLIQIS